MRIAILSDIHGNIVALDAVLADAQAQGEIDEYWVLGDLVDAGPAPVAVLERLTHLPRLKCIRGNTDRYVCSGAVNRFNEPGDAPDFNLEAAGSIAWTQGVITYVGWLDWLTALPLAIESTLPDGTRVLGVHAAPGRDTGLGFKVGLSDEALLRVLGDCAADLIFGGHHHRPLDVTTGGKRIVNVGSVSLPFPPDLRASYLLLTADATGYTLEPRRVDYDREAVLREVQRLRHPGVGYIASLLLGQRQPSGAEFIQRHLADLQRKVPEIP
ncbi:MAG: metallophosphoesterase family protein [Caldilineaceae bacterium]|nr:metallophosphoesterase family protein [Caldilineaceae bacterium]